MRNLRQRAWQVALVLGLAACAAPPGAAVRLEAVVSGLEAPVAVTHAGDGSRRLFVLEQGGTVRVVRDGRLLETPFLDISDKITSGGERGLLGIAFHPQYRSNGLFYLNYTDTAGATVIARYRVSADPDRADPASEAVLLRIAQPYPNHNGGQLAFGPDGYLYVGTGDGGAGGDPQNRAQNPQDLLGKLLRLEVGAGESYAVPSSNPFVNREGFRPEIWATGLRNPWRFSFDRASGDLWIADVGQNAVEEVNYQPANSRGGENYGWRRMEGSRCYQPETNCDDGSLVKPVLEYLQGSDTGRSITGGYVYRGQAVPELQGRYVYGDFVSGRVWAAARGTGGRWTSALLLDTDYGVSTFGEDEAGELYLADYGGGTLYRFGP
ncbi:glucose/arabinose dehydrogenase [Deinobacterium chartae]|uniref:Glucose/arabinose dehydrogenase n=1 Tax=Deinobacterium chartae TaxID=521158 RepID=A0A841I4U4_9DEIO|nr:PQQ-dependent sugar dehydrogenase [Deinobacterium chartae]MBB6098905.1 glucose/arabinose dehydrogenase [Deinobacterium chartae]